MEALPSLERYLAAPSAEVKLSAFGEHGKRRVELLRALTGPMPGQLAVVRDYDRNTATEADRTGHFIARLALCEEGWLRSWFVAREVQLLRVRYLQAGDAERKAFVERNAELCCGRTAEPLSRHELVRHIGARRAGWYDLKYGLFYKVPFDRALGLLSSRSVVLHGGAALVPWPQMFRVVLERFGALLSQQTRALARARGGAGLRDARVDRVSASLQRAVGRPRAYVPKAGSSRRVTRHTVPALARQSFPPCMHRMLSKLFQDHHLKYWGRRTFGLFLKGIGMSLDDALEFWQAAFAPRFDAHTWRRKYSYNIRHNYGKAGKCVDYSPYDCKKVISGRMSGPGEYHVCPFKSCSAPSLTRLLELQGVPGAAIESIVAAAAKSEYRSACQQTFASLHRGVADDTVRERIGNHPNEYYDQSRAFRTEAARAGRQKRGLEIAYDDG